MCIKREGAPIINIIAVDDEHLSLESVEGAIKSAIPGCVLRCFDAPDNAIDYAKENRVGIAFLETEIGTENGLQLAKNLKEINKMTNIIFTTDNPQYAIDAYAIPACGYIIKPISEKAITEAIEYLHNPVKWPAKKVLHVQTFGNFEVFADGKPVRFTRLKTKELFAYLVMRRGARCTNREITSILWEDKQDTPSLQSQYRLLVSDLRKVLRSVNAENVIIKQRGCLACVPSQISCDMYDFSDGKVQAMNNYTGEFMAQYSWSNTTKCYLDRIRKVST